MADYSVTRATVNRWLNQGVGPRTWGNIIRALDPATSTIRRWAREGIPESTLRKLERAPKPKPPKPPPEPLPEIEWPEEDDEEDLADEWIPGVNYDMEYWEELAAQFDEHQNDFEQFEKFS